MLGNRGVSSDFAVLAGLRVVDPRHLERLRQQVEHGDAIILKQLAAPRRDGLHQLSRHPRQRGGE